MQEKKKKKWFPGKFLCFSAIYIYVPCLNPKCWSPILERTISCAHCRIVRTFLVRQRSCSHWWSGPHVRGAAVCWTSSSCFVPIPRFIKSRKLVANYLPFGAISDIDVLHFSSASMLQPCLRFLSSVRSFRASDYDYNCHFHFSPSNVIIFILFSYIYIYIYIYICIHFSLCSEHWTYVHIKTKRSKKKEL